MDNLDRNTLLGIGVVLVLVASWSVGNLLFTLPYTSGREDSASIGGFADGEEDGRGFSIPSEYFDYIYISIIALMGVGAYALYKKEDPVHSPLGIVGLMVLLGFVRIALHTSIVKHPEIYLGIALIAAGIGSMFTNKEWLKTQLASVSIFIGGFLLVLFAAPPIFDVLLGSGSESASGTSGGGGGVADGATSQISGSSGLYIVVGLVVLVIGIVGYNKIRSYIRYRRAVDEEEDMEEDISSTVNRAIRDLHTGKGVRDTVMRCYQNMCFILEDSGVRYDETITPRELKIEAIDKLDVSKSSISDLTTLFEEGRYSSHNLGEEKRDRALKDLKALKKELGD